MRHKYANPALRASHKRLHTHMNPNPNHNAANKNENPKRTTSLLWSTHTQNPKL
jgi:hypothetical protein